MSAVAAEKNVLAWHFLESGGMLRNGDKPPRNGRWLRHEGEVSICESGLHASRRAIDALYYAPGSIVCRVEVSGIVTEQADKLVCRQRKIIWRANCDDVLRAFGRRCALDVIHLWDAPAIVREYLETGDESKRAAARGAAWGAAWDAAWDAARGAAWDAAWDAARDAARGAARAAAWDAAWDAARGAAWAAAWDAAWDAARGAARAAAWAAASDAALDKYNGWLEEALAQLGDAQKVGVEK